MTALAPAGNNRAWTPRPPRSSRNRWRRRINRASALVLIALAIWQLGALFEGTR
jgi:hypothetical protein